MLSFFCLRKNYSLVKSFKIISTRVSLLHSLHHSKMKVGYLQTSPVFGEIERNLSRTIDLITQNKEANLLVLPELCTTGYSFKDVSELSSMAETIPGPSVNRWEKVSKETNTYIVAGIAERSDRELYNSAVLISPKDGLVDVYRKIHLFNTEKAIFTPGNGPPKVYDIARIGIIVCWDWIVPELTRILALYGADIICHSANLVLPFAQKAMFCRSIENRIFTITANRVGEENRPHSSIRFTGQSQIISPMMELLTSASDNKEESVVIEIDPQLARNKMPTPYNHVLADRRIDIYRPLVDFNWEKDGFHE